MSAADQGATRSASDRERLNDPERMSDSPTGRWDVFISQASEDKDTVVRPLAEELARRGLRVWSDEFELKVGDSPSENRGGRT